MVEGYWVEVDLEYFLGAKEEKGFHSNSEILEHWATQIKLIPSLVKRIQTLEAQLLLLNRGRS